MYVISYKKILSVIQININYDFLSDFVQSYKQHNSAMLILKILSFLMLREHKLL